MTGPTIYVLDGSINIEPECRYHQTLKSARDTARALLDGTRPECRNVDDYVEIERCKVADMPARELACALLSGMGWCEADSTVRVETVWARWNTRG